jgi:lipid-binding SYLF domain-containing protein
MFLLLVGLLTAPLVAVSPDQSIRDVQNVLENKGFDPGPLDGVMGPQTRSAIREFQNSNHLEPTGMLDEKTQEALGVKLDTQAALHADRIDQPVSGDVKDESERARKAGTVLSEIMAAPDEGIPADLLEKSHAIAIIPHVVKAAFGFGGRYGKGLISRRNEAGKWTAPAFITIGGGSVGFQIGGSATDLVLVFTNEDGLKPLLKGKFTLGGDASVAAGPVGRTASGSTDITLSSAIYSYSRSKGLFAGVSLDGASITMDDSANQAVYGSPVTGEDILLRSKVQVNQVVRPFIASLEKYVPPYRR